jgi:hypothetical protein
MKGPGVRTPGPLVELLGRYSNRTEWIKLAQQLAEGPSREAEEARKPRHVVRKLQPHEIDSLASEYRAGAGVQELATRYQVHRATVTVLLRRAGVTMRQRGLTAEHISPGYSRDSGLTGVPTVESAPDLGR